MTCLSFSKCGLMWFNHSPDLLREGGIGTNACPQTYPPWKTVLLTCCSKAACVGGNIFTAVDFVKRFFLALSILLQVPILSYINS